MSKFNLNKASKEDILANVSGIGDEMADAVVRYRDEHHGFKNLDEIKQVPGISETRAEKLRENSEL